MWTIACSYNFGCNYFTLNLTSCAYDMLVNAIQIVYISGSSLDSAIAKVSKWPLLWILSLPYGLHYTWCSSTVLNCIKKVHLLNQTLKYSHGRFYLVIVFVLSCCPVLPHQDKNENCIMNSMYESLALSVRIAEHCLQKEKFSVEKTCLLWLPTCSSAFVCFVAFMFWEDRRRRPHFGEVVLQDWGLAWGVLYISRWNAVLSSAVCGCSIYLLQWLLAV